MAYRGPFDNRDFDLDEALSEQRDERVSPVVALAGVIGVIVGLVFWGSLAMSILSTGESAANGGAAPGPATAVSQPEQEPPVDCDNLDAALALSPAREAQLREQCATPAPEPQATPTPDPRTNRADCNTIRGTDYRTPEERQWFLANCVTR
jgi:hypothetical protein